MGGGVLTATAGGRPRVWLRDVTRGDDSDMASLGGGIWLQRLERLTLVGFEWMQVYR